MSALIICIFLVFSIPGLMIPRIVLGCVYQAVQKRQLPTQFMMTDLMWLMLLVQVAMVPLGFLDRRESIRIPLYMFVLIAVPMIWWHSLRVLSRAGVLSFIRRGFFLVFVVPLTLVLTVAGTICGAMLPFTIFFVVRSFRYHLSSEDVDWPYLITPALGILGTVVLVWLMRRAANFILHSVTVAENAKTTENVWNDFIVSLLRVEELFHTRCITPTQGQCTRKSTEHDAAATQS